MKTKELQLINQLFHRLFLKNDLKCKHFPIFALISLFIFLEGRMALAQKPYKSRPNILWLVCEDMSPHLGVYGEKVAKTPVLDQLAKEGQKFNQVFSTAGVCAPSRAALMTGCYQTSIGAQHMRTLGMSANARDAYPSDFQPYSTVLPLGVKPYAELLRRAGYYCTNNAKQDYQFDAPIIPWDESSKKAHWRNRKEKNQPFFAVFNFEVTHESQVWSRAKEPLLVDPNQVEVPAYYPNDSLSRWVMARFLSNVMLMDQQVGQVLEQLKADGLYDDTIIFFYSDHGDGLPYVKRELYDRGLRVPLIIKAPFLKAGSEDNRLISFVDFAPTLLSLAGVPIPSQMQGQAFLGQQKARKPRKYVYAARDRMDSEYDRVRAVFDGRFKYLRNYQPEKPYYQHIRFRLQNPLMPHLLKLHSEGKLNPVQNHWFRPNKPEEELFDLQSDPLEMNNLASNPAFSKKLFELRKAHVKWIKKYGDLGALPEMKMVRDWWGGNYEPPKTANPSVNIKGQSISITCATRGSSLAYRFKASDAWKIYQHPIPPQGDSLEVFAHRIGYLPSRLKIKLTQFN